MTLPKTDEAGIRQAIRALRGTGWQLLFVNNGEDEVPVKNETEAIAEITAVDDASLIVAQGTPTGPRGWVRFVLGNDPEEVVCDYTINLTALDGLTDRWIEESE